jgi:hypothetical protein
VKITIDLTGGKGNLHVDDVGLGDLTHPAIKELLREGIDFLDRVLSNAGQERPEDKSEDKQEEPKNGDAE